MASHSPTNGPSYGWPNQISYPQTQSQQAWQPNAYHQQRQQQVFAPNGYAPISYPTPQSYAPHLPQNQMSFDQNGIPNYPGAFAGHGYPGSYAGGSAPPYPSAISSQTHRTASRMSADQGAFNGPTGSNLASEQWQAAREQVLKSIYQEHKDQRPGVASPAGPETQAGFQAAKEQVLRSVDHEQYDPRRAAASPRGPEPQAEKVEYMGLQGNAAAGIASAPISSTPGVIGLQGSPSRGRGRGGRARARGRGGRGGGRGGKRKKGGSGDEDGSDVSDTYTPSFTVTKSGRSINKPSQYQPVDQSIDSPRGTKRKRGRGGRPALNPYALPDAILCSKCGRGHSPMNNVIVFCDMCNTPYHQWCHDPLIEKEVVLIADREWMCGECATQKEQELVPKEKRVSKAVEDLSLQEQAAYIKTLPASILADLLNDACKMHPGIPIFAPNTRERLRERERKRDEQQNPVRRSSQQSSALSPVPSSNINSNGNIAGNSEYPNDEATYHQRSYDEHPPTYPKPGRGPIKPTPVNAEEDAPWLQHDTEGLEAFSHLYDGAGYGNGGFVGEVGSDAGSDEGLKQDAGKYIVPYGARVVKSERGSMQDGQGVGMRRAEEMAGERQDAMVMKAGAAAM
ncbi:MAG: hypothetical protein M1828_001818 [Chrysothrix sp. TS-e1954]|nr:MAG: hypothetical protein M1828_001818 [Chrysothrix sp. TS-e1954]